MRCVLERQSLTLLREHRPEAVQVEEADYDPASRRLRIVFKDGATFAMEVGSGVDQG